VPEPFFGNPGPVIRHGDLAEDRPHMHNSPGARGSLQGEKESSLQEIAGKSPGPDRQLPSGSFGIIWSTDVHGKLSGIVVCVISLLLHFSWNDACESSAIPIIPWFI
jgi:hypothetical protein